MFIIERDENEIGFFCHECCLDKDVLVAIGEDDYLCQDCLQKALNLINETP